MNIVFFGSDDFAAANLEELITQRQQILACVTPPDKARGRGLKVLPCAVKACALKHRIPVHQPDDLKEKSVERTLAAYGADLFVVIAYGKYLPANILAIPKLFAVNAHASLLPKYRGAAPINWAIINGDKATGVSIIRVNEKMDAGDIIARVRVQIEGDDTAETLRKKLVPASAACLLEAIANIEKETVSFVPQNPKDVSYAPKLTKTTGCIVWKKTAPEIHRLIRGLVPWPGAHTRFQNKTLKIVDSAVVGSRGGAGHRPGAVLDISESGILVATGKDSLLLQTVHPESSRVMPAAAFAAGHKIKPGCVLGN